MRILQYFMIKVLLRQLGHITYCVIKELSFKRSLLVNDLLAHQKGEVQLCSSVNYFGRTNMLLTAKQL